MKFKTTKTMLTHTVGLCAYWKLEWDKSNPDVGWGPRAETVLDETLKALSIPRSLINYKYALEIAKGNKHDKIFV